MASSSSRLSSRGLALLAHAALLVYAPGASALQPLDAFLSSADKQSDDVREAALTTARARAEQRRADWALAPTLTAAAGYKRNQNEVVVTIPTGPTTSKQAVITPYNQLDASLTLSVPLIDAGRWAARSTAAASVSSAELGAQDTLRAAREATSRSYYDLEAAIASHQTAVAAAQVAAARVARDEARAAASTLSQLELERSRATYAQRLQLVAQAELAIQQAAIDLARLSGMSPELTPAPLDQAPPALPAEEAPLDAWLARVERNPAVRRAEAEAARLDALSSQSSRATYLPVLLGQASERATNAAGFGPTTQWTVGVTLQWTLDGAALQALDSSDADAAAAHIRAERARKLNRDTIALAWHQIRALRASAEGARAQETASARALMYATSRYEAGSGTQVELLDAEAAALDASVNRFNADAQLAHARVRLRLLTDLAPQTPRP
jgi:outer membrane protein